MEQVKMHAPEDGPPAMATDGKGTYREAILETWGKVPEYNGRGAPPKRALPGKDWQYLQIIKRREGTKLVSVTTKVIYGDPEEVKAKLGCHTAYVEQTQLTSRTMNGRPLIPTNGERVGPKSSSQVSWITVSILKPDLQV
jgi:hypothetical protein